MNLARFAKLSIAASMATIVLKALAYVLTGSVGLLSDALESIVNVVAAFSTLFMLHLAEKPADEHHAYGHGKAEYFSSVIEGTLIFVSAILIGYSAITRLLDPKDIGQPVLGIIVSTVASAINLVVARTLLVNGKKYRSISLEADGHHLMTDVWTSVGVIIGVALIAVTGIRQLDPIIALAVAVNIVLTGVSLIKRSLLGLLDTAVSEEDQHAIDGILSRYTRRGIGFHGMRSRQAGSRRFISFHVLVPGSWTVRKGHTVIENIEADIRRVLQKTTVFTHLEPKEDPRAYTDAHLDRDDI